MSIARSIVSSIVKSMVSGVVEQAAGGPNIPDGAITLDDGITYVMLDDGTTYVTIG